MVVPEFLLGVLSLLPLELLEPLEDPLEDPLDDLLELLDDLLELEEVVELVLELLLLSFFRGNFADLYVPK